MKPGDLIRVIHSDQPVAREHIGKIGVVVKLKWLHPTKIFEILIDGQIGNFCRSSLELISETR
jgi:hypothetical protein